MKETVQKVPKRCTRCNGKGQVKARNAFDAEIQVICARCGGTGNEPDHSNFVVEPSKETHILHIHTPRAEKGRVNGVSKLRFTVGGKELVVGDFKLGRMNDDGVPQRDDVLLVTLEVPVIFSPEEE